MWHDPVVEEVREFRDAYAKRFDYDLDAMSRDLREKETQSGRKLVEPTPRKADALASRRSA